MGPGLVAWLHVRTLQPEGPSPNPTHDRLGHSWWSTGIETQHIAAARQGGIPLAVGGRFAGLRGDAAWRQAYTMAQDDRQL